MGRMRFLEKKDRLVPTLEPDIEMEHAAVLHGDQGVTAARLDPLEHLVALAGQVHTRVQVAKQATREDRDVHEGRPGRQEVEGALLVGPAAREVFVPPHLQQRVGDRLAGPVQHLSFDPHAIGRVHKRESKAEEWANRL